MSAPEKLRLELQRLRDRGEPFKRAWGRAVHAALADESLDSTIFWRQVFNSQRDFWACSYSRAPFPANSRPALTPEILDDEHSEPARSGRRTSAPLILA